MTKPEIVSNRFLHSRFSMSLMNRKTFLQELTGSNL